MSPTSSPVVTTTTMRPTTSSPVGSATTTMKPTDGTTNDPFKPPPPPDLPQSQGNNIPTYSPTDEDMTFAPTVTASPNTPFPSYSPTRGDERMVPKPDGGSGGVGGSQRVGGGGGGGGGEATYPPTFAWPTFSPTSNPTSPDSNENDESGTNKQPRGGGGWLDEDEDEDEEQEEDGMLDDDELIGLHHHRHHHHRPPPQAVVPSPAAGRKRVLQVINVDTYEVKDGISIKDAGNSNKDDSSSSDDSSSNKDVHPPYYQPPAVHKSTLDAWTSIHPNDVFFTKHPELKSYQEEIYRMKHGLPSSSSSSSSSPTASSASSITRRTRSLQDDTATGLMPTRLISAQFLEMDTSPNMQIINQDDQYLNVTFPDPSNIVLQFSSISNLLDPAMPLGDQLQYVPGGAILIFVGATDSGEIVRNRMMWTYTMGCGLEDYTVLDGNVIGWAGFVSV